MSADKYLSIFSRHMEAIVHLLLPFYKIINSFLLPIEVVELDSCISEIAKTWFQFKEDERMKIIIEDGLKYRETNGLCSAFLRFKYL